MKQTNKFLMLLAIFALTGSISSVMAQSRDIPTSILGEYVGELYVSSDDLGLSETFYDIPVELKESAPNYALKIKEMDLGGGVYLPEFELDDVEITESGDGYQLSKSGALHIVIDEIEVPGFGTLTDVPVDITLENGYVEDNVLTLNIKAVATVWGFIPITVNIDFEGMLPLPPPDCDPVTNLTAVYTEDCEVLLTWDAASGNSFNIYRDGLLIIANHDQTSYIDSGFNLDEAHTWLVTAVCDGGDESEPADVTLSDGCTPPLPCNPATDLTVEYVADACIAILTWTAAADMPDATYNVYRDGTKIAGDVTETEYMDDNFPYNVKPTWTVKTICTEGEADGVDVTGEECGVGINELANSISIYPNPSNTSVTINAKDFAKVEVYNAVGQLIETTTANTVDVSSYNTGIYFFKIYDVGGNSVTKRVMVAR